MSRREPVYRQIAKDIAHRMVRGELEEHTRLSGRSILSSDYGVSPETIRRSLNLLAEYHCVQVVRSSGVIIGKKEHAIRFLSELSSTDDVTELRHRLTLLMEQRQALDIEISEVIDMIVDQASRFSHTDPLNRFEFVIESHSKLDGVTIADSQFYQLTNMTIIGMTRDGEMQLSPGPKAVLKTGDVLIVSGSLEDVGKVQLLVQSSD